MTLASEGCGLFQKSEEEPVQAVISQGRPPGSRLTVGDLDHLARNFSDRLVARVSTACDQIKRETSDLEPRAKAHQLKLSVALAAYDIVTSPGGSSQMPDAAQHVLDLVILTELHALRWVDEQGAREAFEEPGSGDLSEALVKSREDIWQIAAQMMNAEQIDDFRTMILHWRQQNPKVEWLSRVRLDVIAQGKAGAGFTQAVAEGFNPIKAVLRAVDESRIVAQQALFWAKRLPMILDWTMEAILWDALAVPRVDALVQGLTETMGAVTRAASTLERLTGSSSEEPAINATIGEVNESLVHAKDLVREVRGLEAAVEPLLNKHNKETPTGKPLDLDRMASKVDDAARDATSLVRETRGLAESPSAMRSVDEVLGRASRNLVESGQAVIDHAAWRALELVLLVGGLVVAFKAVSYGLKKRRPGSAKA